MHLKQQAKTFLNPEVRDTFSKFLQNKKMLFNFSLQKLACFVFISPIEKIDCFNKTIEKIDRSGKLALDPSQDQIHSQKQISDSQNRNTH